MTSVQLDKTDKRSDADQKNMDCLAKLLRVYFQLDEVLSFAAFELQDDEIVAEISAVKVKLRSIIERLIS